MKPNGRLLYRTLPCVYPDCDRRPTCFCHYPKHRGIGGKNAGWGLLEGFPGCDVHHRLFDHQYATWRDQEAAREAMIPRIWAFWKMILMWESVYELGPERQVEAVRLWTPEEEPWMIPS